MITAETTNQTKRLVDYPGYLKAAREYADTYGVEVLAEVVMEIKRACRSCDEAEARARQAVHHAAQKTLVYRLGSSLGTAHVSSLDDPVGAFEDGDTPIIDGVASEDPDPSEHLHLEEVKKLVAEFINSLAGNERLARAKRVLALRYGIGCEPHTLHEVGTLFGITRERARQLEAEGLRAAKRHFVVAGFTEAQL